MFLLLRVSFQAYKKYRAALFCNPAKSHHTTLNIHWNTRIFRFFRFGNCGLLGKSLFILTSQLLRRFLDHSPTHILELMRGTCERFRFFLAKFQKLIVFCDSLDFGSTKTKRTARTCFQNVEGRRNRFILKNSKKCSRTTFLNCCARRKLSATKRKSLQKNGIARKCSRDLLT